jgi:hypothetical protein
MSRDTQYIHPDGRKALEAAYKLSGLKPVIVQTYGTAPQSKGTHGVAGYYKNWLGKKIPYSPCVDFSVKQKAYHLLTKKYITMDEQQIRWFLFNCSKVALCGWFRTEQQGFDDEHVHLITPMVDMEDLPIVCRQVVDFVNDRSGLASHGPEHFWTAPTQNDEKIAKAFAKCNPTWAPRLPQSLLR